MIDESNKYPLLNNLIKTDSESIFYWFDPESETEIFAEDLYESKELKDNINIRFNKFSNHSKDTLWKDFNSNNIYSARFFLKRKLKIGDFDTYLNTIDSSFTSNIIDLELDPEQDQWNKNIKACYDKFKNENFEKIVMSRKAEFSLDNSINPIDLLVGLMKVSFNSTFFYLRLKDSIFLGASPEKLFFRKGNIIHSDSLAGTRPRGSSKEEDEQIENELLSNEKELREQAIVSDEIIKIFNGICDSVNDNDPVKIKKLSNLQHIHKAIKGELKRNISDDDIIDVLHPTPAVGGVPREKAIQAISEIENHDRGLYASPIGWQLGDESQYIVGIRSLLYRTNLSKAFIFTGAGIVDGSIAEKEWKEINNKMKTYLTILQYDFKE